MSFLYKHMITPAEIEWEETVLYSHDTKEKRL